MNQYFVIKKILLSNLNISKFISLLIILFPISIIIGPALVELTAILIALYGLYILFEKKLFKINSIFLLFILIYLFSNLSSLLGNHPYESFSRSLFLFRYPLFLFGIYYCLSNNRKTITYLFLLSSLCVAFVFLDDLVQLTYDYDIFGFKKQAHRLSGPFDDELIPGLYLFRFGLISICFLFMNTKANFNKIFILSIILLLGVIITGEKTSSVITLLSFIFFFILRFGINKIVYIFFAFIIFISSFIILINSNETYKDRIWKETQRTLGIFQDNRNFFDSEHGAMFLTSIHIWKDNKLIGGGLKTYRENCKLEKYDKIKSLVISERCSTHPHNFYLEILAELGIVGLLLYLYLIFYFFIKIYKNYLENNNIVTLGVFCILLGIFFPLNFTNSFFTNFNLLWITFIISLGLIKFEDLK